jgi:hypothetical protein
MDKLAQAAEEPSVTETEIDERFYQPRLIWGYFLNWIRQKELKDQINVSGNSPTLLIFRKSEDGAYHMHNHILYWTRDVSGSGFTNCDQDALWYHSEDLGEVQGYISPNYPMTYPVQWNSFEEFFEEICGA